VRLEWHGTGESGPGELDSLLPLLSPATIIRFQLDGRIDEALLTFHNAQVELSTNHGSLTRIMDRLRKLDYRVRRFRTLLSHTLFRHAD
jgi:hypothetical protein